MRKRLDRSSQMASRPLKPALILAEIDKLPVKLDGRFVVHKICSPHSLAGYRAFDLKPSKLIILQHHKDVGEFFQARCKFISPLVREKHR